MSLERNYTTSTVATASTAPTTFSGSSRDKDTIAERTTVGRSESYGNKFREPATSPAPLSDRQSSEPDRSVTTARSHLATEIRRLKSQEAREDGANLYGDDDYYDDDDDYYSDEESLDSYVNFSLLSNIAVWMRDQVPRGTHVKGSIPYPRAFTGKDIVVCIYFFVLVCTTFDQIFYTSLHSSRASSPSSSSAKASQRTIGRSHCKLRAASNSNFSFTKSSGAGVSFRMVSRMCICSLMTRRAVPMLRATARNFQRA
jgi:hypothetical protein